MMIGHYTASIFTHYRTSNMAAVFSDCMLGEPHIAILIYKILGCTWYGRSLGAMLTRSQLTHPQCTLLTFLVKLCQFPGNELDTEHSKTKATTYVECLCMPCVQYIKAPSHTIHTSWTVTVFKINSIRYLSIVVLINRQVMQSQKL